MSLVSTCSHPGDNPFYCAIDSMPDIRPRRKSIPLVSELVSSRSRYSGKQKNVNNTFGCISSVYKTISPVIGSGRLLNNIMIITTFKGLTILAMNVFATCKIGNIHREILLLSLPILKECNLTAGKVKIKAYLMACQIFPSFLSDEAKIIVPFQFSQHIFLLHSTKQLLVQKRVRLRKAWVVKAELTLIQKESNFHHK